MGNLYCFTAYYIFPARNSVVYKILGGAERYPYRIFDVVIFFSLFTKYNY